MKTVHLLLLILATRLRLRLAQLAKSRRRELVFDGSDEIRLEKVVDVHVWKRVCVSEAFAMLVSEAQQPLFGEVFRVDPRHRRAVLFMTFAARDLKTEVDGFPIQLRVPSTHESRRKVQEHGHQMHV